MAASTARIVIRHLSGSKINQIEQFDLEGLQEITLGRDPTSRIAYDLQRDDEVSRRHAVIRIKHDKDLYFRLADLNSSNGTFLNGERIGGEVELLPEDIVELGSSGPKFIFDVQPRPASLPARTRQMGAADAAAADAATRLLTPAAKAGATVEHAASDTRQRTGAGDTAALQKVAVGKATIQRMLFDERRKARSVLIGSIAAVLVLAALGGGALLWHNRSVEAQFEQRLADAQHQADANRQQADARLKEEMGITPAEIKRLGDATVYIRNSWQLFDTQTDRPVYQKMVTIDHKLMPAFVRLNDNDHTTVRWLTLDQTSTYEAVGAVQSGSGFVIDPNGYILTNIHVASAWEWRFQDYRDHNWSSAAVYNLDDRPSRRPKIISESDVANLSDFWVPGFGGYIFEPSRPHLLSSDQRDFFGRNDVLTVRFPGTRTDFNATLVKIAPDSDVAEIKIDATGLSKLDLADDGSVGVGEKIILLGYPEMSNETYAEPDSNVRGITRFFIPEPTVTEGVVAKLPSQTDKKDQGEIKMKDKFGNMYQLDITAGPGSSGGPVLDKQGKVIGLMSMGLADEEHVSFAVPVSSVHEMLQAQRQ
jgi:serine protease Do